MTGSRWLVAALCALMVLLAPLVAAQPAPRRADGSWPPETCSLHDPTTSGCLTPRAEHALEQVKLAVRNATAPGVMYVIWYRQIWTPATGWHPYSSGQGDPSSDHTNHVHLSVY